MDCINSIVNASKNAVIYGYRVRFIHTIAVQASSLDRNQQLTDQLVRKILKSVRLGLDHGKVLALFAIIYKSIQLSLSKTSTKDPDALATHFLGGLVGGVLVYGGVLNSKFKGLVNEGVATQITLYCMSRVILAIGKWFGRILEKRGGLRRSQVQKFGWRATTGAVWGLLVVFYAADKNLYLQPALRRSLDFQFGDAIYSWLEAFNYSR
ncbi:hypothetical protein OGAPHI_001873 [Ogataea philodendri]|uniref:Peroxisomal membrane protein 4 n=1 Tax=Ogataea philodendri TaxID=1378263 RepID=A0A9P8T753_9ASCO|nr:uncharacterized protein OGAPHI_001873 [Ogataea philodendri]KAH3668119.1 hypothetical protein OGAPHI_001873 [Ogataea philodendri]